MTNSMPVKELINELKKYDDDTEIIFVNTYVYDVKEYDMKLNKDVIRMYIKPIL